MVMAYKNFSLIEIKVRLVVALQLNEVAIRMELGSKSSLKRECLRAVSAVIY